MNNKQVLLPLEIQKPSKLRQPDTQNRYPGNREAELMTRVVRIESKVHHLMGGHEQAHEDLYAHHQSMVQAVNTLYEAVTDLRETFEQFKQEWDEEVENE